MNISERDRRALIGLGIAAVVILVIQFWPSSADSKTPAGITVATVSPEMLESRLLKVRSLAAEQPGRLKILYQVKDELKTRIDKTKTERRALQKQVEEVSKKRDAFIQTETKRLAAAGKGDSFDEKVALTLREQAAKKGISYTP